MPHTQTKTQFRFRFELHISRLLLSSTRMASFSKECEQFLSLTCSAQALREVDQPVEFQVWRKSFHHGGYFDVLDGGKSLAILKSGNYRVHVYLRPGNDTTTRFFLDVNGDPKCDNRGHSNAREPSQQSELRG